MVLFHLTISYIQNTFQITPNYQNIHFPEEQLNLFKAMYFILFSFAVIALAIPAPAFGCVQGPPPPREFGKIKCDQSESTSEARIVGGRRALPGEIPYILSLQRNGEHFCAGNFIQDSEGRQVVVTAGHCFPTQDTDGLIVTAGALSRSQNDGDAQILSVSRIVVHPGYFMTRDYIPLNDIAILFLSGSFLASKNVKPIQLPAAEVDGNAKVKASGWGRTHLADNFSDQLLVVNTAVIGNAECEQIYTPAYQTPVVFPSNICAGDVDSYRGVCKGDSGGPLVSSYDEPSLLGVNSWVKGGCERLDFPAVYTRVSTFVPWIQATVDAEFQK